jgi:hypothetical protein
MEIQAATASDIPAIMLVERMEGYARLVARGLRIFTQFFAGLRRKDLTFTRTTFNCVSIRLAP